MFAAAHPTHLLRLGLLSGLALHVSDRGLHDALGAGREGSAVLPLLGEPNAANLDEEIKGATGGGRALRRPHRVVPPHDAVVHLHVVLDDGAEAAVPKRHQLRGGSVHLALGEDGEAAVALHVRLNARRYRHLAILINGESAALLGLEVHRKVPDAVKNTAKDGQLAEARLHEGAGGHDEREGAVGGEDERVEEGGVVDEHARAGGHVGPTHLAVVNVDRQLRVGDEGAAENNAARDGADVAGLGACEEAGAAEQVNEPRHDGAAADEQKDADGAVNTDEALRGEAQLQQDPPRTEGGEGNEQESRAHGVVVALL